MVNSVSRTRPLAPVLRYVGLAAAVVPAAGVGLWYAAVLPFSSRPGVAVPVGAMVVAAGLAVVFRAGRRRGYPPWLIALAMVASLVMAVPWLFVIGFGTIAVACSGFDQLCLD